MPFLFDWATLGSANGSSTITDGANSTLLTVASDPALFYNAFLGGNLFVSQATAPVASNISFTTPVKNATFEILDLDSNESTFDDKVTVNAFDIDGNPVAVIFSNLEAYHVQTGNTVEANGATSPAVDGAGAPDSITVSFGGPVASIQVIFDNGSGATRTGVIGLGDISGDVVCFARGTLIETDQGLVAIEDISLGDMIATMDDGLQPVRWAGSRRVSATGRFAPIKIAKGFLDNERDLFLSPQHRVLLRGWRAELHFGEAEVLVTAKHLTAADGVSRRESEEVEYFHIMFDKHQVIFAEGAPCESFHPGPRGVDGMDDDQRAELFAIFPELEDDFAAYGPSARPSLASYEGELLAAVR